MTYKEALESVVVVDPYVQQFVWAGTKEPGALFLDFVAMNAQTGEYIWTCAGEQTIYRELDHLAAGQRYYESLWLQEDDPLCQRNVWHAGTMHVMRDWIAEQFGHRFTMTIKIAAD